ncbi:ATP-dependent helicase HrpB [Bartonella tamiae]|uniref:ATP-dependent helicase HrpB n=1 Tax=Bartonella tamiae Th239 TaxID=1094558 RepID=J0QYL3_9HYPH|nr:ATP-dependent helicase HrpB [Bartonella tamiae]EJF91201.1 ATP-dependent helicase HrpB [Bartonella tamiae Th239]EJF93134.1 ATP-dependent helicase HrpB [Bartonella tamiae Th307]
MSQNIPYDADNRYVAKKLPICDVLPKIDAALEQTGTCVLIAPPGAGKTTIVPLHLLKKTFKDKGKIILLEPRRLAARSAAKRMAQLLGEDVGQTVGYQMRLDSKISSKTKILVVTEGVFARMIVDDPELTDIKAVLFDEFHERSIDADFGLALALDVRQSLRPDLSMIVMSATLEGRQVANLLQNAPIIESLGRSYPVEIIYEPRKSTHSIEQAMATTIKKWLLKEEGSILAFLPGQKEIKKTATLLAPLLNTTTHLALLYGGMDLADQDQAIRRSVKGHRKIVLATSIAESSLTIDDIRIVIDSGLSRIPFYDAASSMTKLQTVKASRDSIDQRAGRAGRTMKGLAIRLWHQGQTASLPSHSHPEILSADLSNLILESTAFGIKNIENLSFLDKPPLAHISEAKSLLTRLEALDKDGHLTLIGQAMRNKALPVRLAAMLLKAEYLNLGYLAGEIAVILTERGLGGTDIDLDIRLDNFRKDTSERAKKARALIKRLTSAKYSNHHQKTAYLLMLAWPDRIAKARSQHGFFILSNGRGATLDTASPLAKAPYLVIGDISGKADNARILSAAALDEKTMQNAMHKDFITRIELDFDKETKNFKAIKRTKLGALTIHESAHSLPKGEEANNALLDVIRHHGLNILPWEKQTKALRERLDWVFRQFGKPWPDMSDKALIDGLEDWLLPFLKGDARLDTIDKKKLSDALTSLVPYALQSDLLHMAPTHFTVPTGSSIPIHYEGDIPVLSVRVQEVFGLAHHPTIAKGKIPLMIELLSPAGRPIQITRNLPLFWQGSWADVRIDMKGRYPKHPWPENPLNAPATKHVKKRYN